MRLLALIGALALLAGAGGLLAVLLGLPDVAATTPHAPAVAWLLATAMEHGVERHARGVSPPTDLDDPERVREGAAAYDAMCALCHGAPGAEAGPIGKGLLPEPPALANEPVDWSEGELFWIVSHGIRMTGMPAFGATHDDDELWDLVSFLRRLPTLGPEEYQALVGPTPGAAHRHGHAHGSGPAGGHHAD